MAKLTFLELTQDILSDMNSDSVNSIADTVEADQVARIVKATYFKILSNKDWPHLRGTLELTSSGSVLRPTHFVLPDNLQRIQNIKYNKIGDGESNARWDDIHWMENDVFLTHIHARNSSDTNVTSVPDYVDNRTLLVMNDRSPTYWTSFDDEHIVMDSYDSAVDSTLQASKVMCIGYRSPVWQWEDAFVPDLPEKMFPYLLAEAKSTAFATIKQMPNAKEEQWSTRLKANLSQDKFRQNGKMKYASYGRK